MTDADGPFHFYVADVALSPLRWKRFWLIGPKCCKAWALLLSVDLSFSVAATAIRLRPDLFEPASESISEWKVFPHALEMDTEEIQRRVIATPDSTPTFQSLFPDALADILDAAAVPSRLAEKYGAAAEAGSEVHLDVLLGTKVPAGAAWSEAQRKARLGLLFGRSFPDYAVRLAQNELNVWAKLKGPELPAWPTDAFQDLATFEKLVSNVVSGWQR